MRLDAHPTQHFATWLMFAVLVCRWLRSFSVRPSSAMACLQRQRRSRSLSPFRAASCAPQFRKWKQELEDAERSKLQCYLRSIAAKAAIDAKVAILESNPEWPSRRILSVVTALFFEGDRTGINALKAAPGGVEYLRRYYADFGGHHTCDCWMQSNAVFRLPCECDRYGYHVSQFRERIDKNLPPPIEPLAPNLRLWRQLIPTPS